MLEAFDATLLARLQFAFTVSFHFIFPAFSIGLASYLAVLEGLWLKTGRQVYLDLFKYWLKIFALAFGMGVVSGIVMSYQFGTNWSVFSDKAGPVIGPLMAYEVLTAFFLEAGFLGVMLFGMNKVGRDAAFRRHAGGRGRHLHLGLLDPVGQQLDADAGRLRHQRRRPVRAGRLVAIIFNPSFPYRLVHTVLAAYLTTALVVGAVGAWHLLRDARPTDGARVDVLDGDGMIAVVAPLQILAGDQHGLNTLEHQPAKVMAMEGHFKSHPDGAPLILFGWPDQAAGETLYAVEIPKASSLILKHRSTRRSRASIRSTARTGRRWRSCSGRSASWSGWACDAGARRLWSLLARVRATGSTTGRCCIASPLVMGPAGFVAVIAGWVTTEVGRQPYTVYGLLRTADSASPLAGAGGGGLAAGLHRRLLRRVRRRRLLHPAADEPAAAARRGGARARPADARGRHHAGAGRAEIARRAEGGLIMLTFDLPIIWAGIIAFAIFAYVVMDGFDLGIGILFPCFRRAASATPR